MIFCAYMRFSKQFHGLYNVACNKQCMERSGSVVECLTRNREAAGSEPHRRHCVVVFEQDTFILA